MPLEVAKPIGLKPFVTEAMKQKTSLCLGISAHQEKIRQDEQIRQTAPRVGFFGIQPVILPGPPKFSDSFSQDTSALGSKLRAMLGQDTPALKQNFWLWESSTDASSRDSESDAEVNCEDEENDECEDEDEVKSQYEATKAEDKSQYEATKAEVIKHLAANDPNSKRVAAMEAVHQPVPGAKAGKEEPSMKEYLSYGKSLMSDMFRKSSSNNKESTSKFVDL